MMKKNKSHIHKLIILLLQIIPTLAFGQLTVNTTHSNLTATSITISATFTGGQSSHNVTNCILSYGTSSGNYGSGQTEGLIQLVSSNGGVNIFQLSDLSPSTDYYYIIDYTYQGSDYESTENTFSTAAPEPAIVTTDSTSEISSSGVRLNATIETGSILPTDQIHFEWGTSTSYGNSTNATPNSTSFNTNASLWIDGAQLSSGTTYHYRIAARDQSLGYYQTLYGTDRTFKLYNTPVAQSATDLKPYSFQANWSHYSDAATYILDVSSSATFDSYVSGYHGLEIEAPGTSFIALENLTPGTIYYYRIRVKLQGSNNTTANSNTISLQLPGTLTWTGLQTADWHTTGNWDMNTLPDEHLKVVIPGSLKAHWPNISSNENIDQLEMEEGSQLTINSAASLTVNQNGLLIPPDAAIILNNGNLIINSGNLMIESESSGSGGLVIQDDASTVSLTNGSNIMERYISGGTWHAVSTPVAGELAGQYFFDHNPVVYLLRHLESSSWDGSTEPCEDCWDYIEELTTPLTSMQGYFYWADAAAATIDFSGTFHNGNISFDLTDRNTTADADGSGWNFVGNPYPSPFNWDNVSIPAGCDDAIYFWQPGSGADGDYKSWVNGGGGSENAIVPIGQGFFVHATDDDISLQLTNSCRVHNTKSFYKEDIRNELKISIGDYLKDEMYIRINDEASENFDKSYDAYKYFGTNIPQVYTISPKNELLEIQSLPKDSGWLEVPISFRFSEDGNYEIGFEQTESFDAETNIYLKNNETDDLIDLRNKNSIEFYFEAGVHENPFSIVITQSSMSVEEKIKDDYSIYSDAEHIIIKRRSKSMRSDFRFAVYDLTGRIIKQGNLPGSQVIIDMKGHAHACYIVQVTGAERIRQKKIMF